MFDAIEKLKRDFTDKYVEVEAIQPELSRFKGRTGVVKTVNMNGRALVEFDANDNIGWYDIDLSFLKVVDRPAPKAAADAKPAAKPAAAKAAPAKPAAAKAAPAAGEKKMSPLEMARAQGAAKTGDAPKKSTADVLAAARGGQPAPASPAASATKAPAAKGKPSTADILAAARAKSGAGTAQAAAPAAPPAPPPPAAKPPAAATGKKTTAEILAAARGASAPATSKAPAAAPAEQAAPPIVDVAGSLPDQPISEQPVTAPPVVAASPAPVVEKPAAASKGDLPKTTPDIIAWCRQRDAKS